MKATREVILSLLLTVSLVLTVPWIARGEESNELVVGFTVDVQTLDPRYAGTVQGFSMLQHIYETLVTFDEKGKLVPRLATSWEFPNANTILFRLRKGVKFHNGEPFNAEAVKYTIETINNNPRAFSRPWISDITRVDTPDPYTVVLNLKAPAARAVIGNLGVYLLIMPPRFSTSAGDRFTSAVGTGPFRFVEYRPGERLVLEANREYWGKPARVKRLVFRVIAEPASRVAALERGEVDVAFNFPIDQMARLKGDPNITFYSRPTVRIAFVGFRLDHKPFDDVRVRQALVMAIDRQAINNELLGGRGRIPNTVITPEVFGYARGVTPPPYDPAAARQLLRAAGQEGLLVRFGTSNGRFVSDRQIGEAIAAYWQQIGVRVQFEAPEFGTFFAETAKADSKYDSYFLSWAAVSYHADYAITPAFHQDFSTRNMYKSAEASRLMEQARGAVDETQSAELYGKVQEMLIRDLPWAPIITVPDVVGARRDVEGLRLNANELVFLWNTTKRAR